MVLPHLDAEADDDKALLRDKCGVVAFAGTTPAAGDIATALRALQHRGQESAGIAVVEPDGLVHHRGMGLVEQVFDPAFLRNLTGHVGIGHVRYATTGASRLENAQPILVNSAVGEVAIAHNGDFVNSAKLREELMAKGWSFLTTSDTEVALRMLAAELAVTKDRPRAIRNVLKRLTGSYSLVILIAGTVYAVRDPLGIKPLCYGTLPDGGYVVASESTALNVLGAELVRDVAPGEILEITPKSLGAFPGTSDDAAHCMFEYVYFARADSVLDARPVYDVRHTIGRILAQEARVPNGEVVVPVPDSGRTHALGFAAESGIPFTEGLMKNRYVHRTFIMPDQDDRDRGVRMKLNPVKSVVAGKSVVLVDDSIVRGTTMRRIVKMLREAGAREVHVRIGSPPIVAPCYLGIDMNTRKQLVASDHSVKEIQEMLGADSLQYISLEGLTRAIRLPKKDLCMGCLTGEYPVPIPGEAVRVRHQVTLPGY